MYGCTAASCNFGIHTGEDEHMAFYSAILFVDVLFIIGDWKAEAGSQQTAPVIGKLALEFKTKWGIG